MKSLILIPDSRSEQTEHSGPLPFQRLHRVSYDHKRYVHDGAELLSLAPLCEGCALPPDLLVVLASYVKLTRAAREHDLQWIWAHSCLAGGAMHSLLTGQVFGNLDFFFFGPRNQRTEALKLARCLLQAWAQSIDT